MLALAFVAAALAVGHADRRPIGLPVGVAFTRHSDSTNELITWNGRVEPYSPEATTWSPSGRYLVRYHYECNNGACKNWDVVSRPDGSGAHILTDPGSGISWSRDESKLVYVQAGRLAIADGDGANVRLLTTDIAACGDNCTVRLDEPTLSPDGTAVAMLVTAVPTSPDGPFRNIPAHLWTVPATGGTATSLHSDGICPPDTDLRWSSDGALVAFVANPCDQASGYDLDVTDLGGQTILSTPLRGPYAFARVGEILAYTTKRGVGLEVQGVTTRVIAGARSPSWQPGSHNRLAVDVEGWVAVVDPPNARPHRLYRGSSPVWTAHGIAYAVPRCGPRQGIWLGRRQLTNVCTVDGAHGTPWRDEVWAVDHKREHVSCGAGFDVAHVDAKDVVARDCERVVRG